jgi:hypothetical protein
MKTIAVIFALIVARRLRHQGRPRTAALESSRPSRPMHHFSYRDGVLHAEDVNLKLLADEIGTPFYCYSSATLERHYKVMRDAFAAPIT